MVILTLCPAKAQNQSHQAFHFSNLSWERLLQTLNSSLRSLSPQLILRNAQLIKNLSADNRITEEATNTTLLVTFAAVDSAITINYKGKMEKI